MVLSVVAAEDKNQIRSTWEEFPLQEVAINSEAMMLTAIWHLHSAVGLYFVR